MKNTNNYKNLLRGAKEFLTICYKDNKKVTSKDLKDAIEIQTGYLHLVGDAVRVAGQLDCWYIKIETIEYGTTLYECCIEMIDRSLSDALFEWLENKKIEVEKC